MSINVFDYRHGQGAKLPPKKSVHSLEKEVVPPNGADPYLVSRTPKKETMVVCIAEFSGEPTTTNCELRTIKSFISRTASRPN